ncbi:MAG: tRNA lysidine(34) synthetase TilS [Clostridia bacterium]|nr:tRNA lysidine(34) synthetase TilS [Clostridia bacterium]
MKEEILEKVKAYVTGENMISAGDKVLLALSGGADSVAMAHILLTLSGEMGFSVCAAHLNHCLRSEESDYDELFVRNFCSVREIELKVERADIAALASASKRGIEECARSVRYDFLFRAAAEFGADRIATAHTLSDNAETLIFNIVRGSGLKGICGIPETRGKLIRPLLRLTREETEGYDREAGLPYVTDSTNSDTDYTRNYIRQEIIPRLTELNPSFLASVERLTGAVKEDNSFIEREADRLLAVAGEKNCDLAILREADPSVVKRVLARIYSDFTGRKLDAKGLNAFLAFVNEEGDGRTQLPGAFAVKYSGQLKLTDSAERKQPKRFYFAAEKMNVLPDGRMVMIHVEKGGSAVDGFDIDASRIVGSLRLRLRVPTDEMRLPKRPTKSLKKLFSEMKIPIEERDRAVVLCDDKGIVWVEKLGAAEHTAASVFTDRILKIEIKSEE